MNSKSAVFHLLLWCLALVLLPQLALFLFPDRKQDKRVETFHAVAHELEAITLGPSHTRAIHYPSMGLKGFSFADDGGDVELAELKFRLIDDYAINLKYVFIPVAPGFLSYNRIAAIPEEFPYDYLRFSPKPKSWSELSLKETWWLASAEFLKLKEAALTVNNETKKSVRSGVYSVIGKKEASGEIICQFIMNPPEYPDEDGVQGGFARTPVDASCMTPEWIEADAQRRLKSFGASLENAPDTLEKNIAYLEKMTQNAAKLGAKMVFVISPTAEDYFEHPGLQEYWARELPLLQSLESYDNVIFLDIHEEFYDYDYTKENIYYSDPDHISYEGAVRFSKKLSLELEKQLSD